MFYSICEVFKSGKIPLTSLSLHHKQFTVIHVVGEFSQAVDVCLSITSSTKWNDLDLRVTVYLLLRIFVLLYWLCFIGRRDLFSVVVARGAIR